jgi:nucleoside-diphosphate-sugar epimerase
MIIGSGLLAQAFSNPFSRRDDVCIFAAGVSNSGCIDAQEFERERELLLETLTRAKQVGAFVYFGTCSLADPEARSTPYVQHKLAMERLTATHPRHLILRLPQVAGRTSNPHTLLNFLYARISRSEAFSLWRNARRNIIDIDDAAAIAGQLIVNESMRNATLNIANPVSYSMIDIVGAMERVVGKRAIYYPVDRGSEYAIDTSAILPVLENAGVKFGSDYLEKVMAKYYGRSGQIVTI